MNIRQAFLHYAIKSGFLFSLEARQFLKNANLGFYSAALAEALGVAVDVGRIAPSLLSVKLVSSSDLPNLSPPGARWRRTGQ
jgi:hypothetical protein